MQPHRLHRFGDPSRLVTVQIGGAAGVDLAEVAAAGALVAADEKRCLPILPALVDVGATSCLADRVQALAPDKPLEFAKRRPHGGPGPDPGRLALDGRLTVADLQPQQLAATGVRYRADVRCGGGNAHWSEPTRALASLR